MSTGVHIMRGIVLPDYRFMSSCTPRWQLRVEASFWATVSVLGYRFASTPLTATPQVMPLLP